MEQGVKLLVGTSLEGTDHEFFIYLDSKLGEGGFGIVRRAIEKKSQREFAVKIIPYGGDPNKRTKIERQIDILKLLPQHPNLVRVLPYKCFSENNFYIFMELCPDDTLKEVVHQPGLLQEESIFSFFYQLMSGYRVLWKAGIVHQDLKLANVLIKKDRLKITDFGFSILADKYKATLTREGTLHYMPYEKLTDPDYLADERSDIYSMGVMMFQIITKAHPYVNQRSIKTQKDYVIALRAANILKPKLYVTYSLQLQKLFDLVSKMCAKNIKYRATCEQIYDYLDNDEIFSQFRDKQVEKSEEIQIRPLPVKIEEITKPVFLPFVIEPEEEKNYIAKLKEEQEKKLQEAFQKSLQKIKKWLLGLRLVLYFFDRLGRRLVIEKIKEGLEGDLAHSYNKVVLSCLCFEKQLTKEIQKELKTPSIFTPEEVENFEKSSEGQSLIRLIKKDQEYSKESISDHLKRTVQIEVKEQKELIDLSDIKGNLKPFLKKAEEHIFSCISKRLTSISQRNHLVTLTYMFDSLKLLRDYPAIDGDALEGYFFSTETERTQKLSESVMLACEKADLMLPLFTMEEDDDWI